MDAVLQAADFFGLHAFADDLQLQMSQQCENES